MVEAGGVEPPSRSQRLSSVYVRSPPAWISLLGRPWTRCVGASLGEVSSLGPEARRCDQPTGDVSVGPWALPTETGSSIRPPERSCCRHVMLTVPRCWRGDPGSPARGPEASGNRSKPVRPRSEFETDRHPPHEQSTPGARRPQAPAPGNGHAGARRKAASVASGERQSPRRPAFAARSISRLSSFSRFA